MDCVFKLRSHIDRIWEESEKLPVSGSLEKHFISAMLFVTSNHCDAIQVLIQRRNFASAYALARPMLETAIRSIWLHRQATDAQIKKCMDKDDWPGTWDMVTDIESNEENPKIFSRFWGYLKPVMHSYTHGGKENALRQLGIEGVVTPNIEDSEIREFIQVTGLIAWTTLAEQSDLSGKVDINEALTEIGDSLLDWAFNNQRQGDA